MSLCLLHRGGKKSATKVGVIKKKWSLIVVPVDVNYSRVSLSGCTCSTVSTGTANLSFVSVSSGGKCPSHWSFAVVWLN